MRLSIDVPEHLYVMALRAIADLMDEDGNALPAPIDTGGTEQPSAWQVTGLTPHPWTSEFQLLSELYASITPQARRLIDELLHADRPTVHQDELISTLELKGTSALAGTVGHITKTAEALGRQSPIHRDPVRKTYSVAGNLAEALRQARLWACSEILSMENWNTEDPPRRYVHEFSIQGTTYRHVSEHPKRYLMLPREGLDDIYQPSFYRDTDSLLEAFGEAFDEAEMLVLEFVPDHENDVLRGYMSREPGDLGEPFMFDGAPPDEGLKPFPAGFEVEEAR